MKNNINNQIKNQYFYKHTVSRFLVIAIVLLVVAGFITTMVVDQPTANLVPTRFTSLRNFDRFGSWQDLYVLPVAGLFFGIGNIMLAAKALQKSRFMAIVILITSVMLLILINITVIFLTTTVVNA